MVAYLCFALWVNNWSTLDSIWNFKGLKYVYEIMAGLILGFSSQNSAIPKLRIPQNSAKFAENSAKKWQKTQIFGTLKKICWYMILTKPYFLVVDDNTIFAWLFPPQNSVFSLQNSNFFPQNSDFPLKTQGILAKTEIFGISKHHCCRRNPLNSSLS